MVLTLQGRWFVLKAAAVHGLCGGGGERGGGLVYLARVRLLRSHHPCGSVAHRLGIVILAILPDRTEHGQKYLTQALGLWNVYMQFSAGSSQSETG